MADREKVINDLQDAVNDDWLWRHADYYALTMERAIALLKEQNQRIWELLCEQDKLRDMLQEQEAVKPVPPEDEFGLYRCGKCYHQLFRCVDKYCSRCGQAVKWE